MADKLSVWCDALFILGISSVNTTTPEDEATRTLNEAWQGTVEGCLEQGDWDFAKERDQLARSSPAPAFGYSYYYTLPSDCLRLVFISQSGLPSDPLLRYTNEKGKIATDAETVYAVWVSSDAITAPGRWSSSFARFVSASLAERCLKLNPGAKDDVALALKKSKPQAEGVDAVQQPPVFRKPGRWATAGRGRRGSYEQGSW